MTGENLDQLHLLLERFTAAQKLAEIGTWTLDLSNQKVEWSDLMFKILGLDRKKNHPSVETYQNIIHPDDLERLTKINEIAISQGVAAKATHRIIRPDGATRWVKAASQVIKENGKPAILHGIVQDITDLTEAESAVTAQSRWFEMSLDLLCITDNQGSFLQLNPAWEKTLGWTMEELKSKPFIEYVHPDDQESTNKEAAKLADKVGTVIGFENRYLCKDGSYRLFRWNSSVDPETGNLYAVARDVTDDQMEADRFQGLLDAAPDAMVLTDSAGIITYTNKQVHELFGYKPNELVGKKVEVLVPQQFRNKHPTNRKSFHENPKTRPMGAGLALTAAHKDGHEIPVEISLAPLETSGGRIVMAAIRDITDRLQAQETERLAFQQRMTIEQLEEANNFRISLLNTVAHELNTPLTPLNLQMHILSKDLDGLPPVHRKAMEILGRNLRRLTLLVSDILDMSRMQNEQLDLRLGDVIATDLVEDTIGTFSETASSGKVTLDHTVEPELKFKGDGARITQVLYNLTSNAIKFTPEGGSIHIHGRAAGNDVLFEIVDSGLGITKKEEERLFRPFGQVHENQPQKGTGLGLFISRGIVEQHGGTLTMTSRGKDKGTTFTIRIPIAGPPQ